MGFDLSQGSASFGQAANRKAQQQQSMFDNLARGMQMAQQKNELDYKKKQLEARAQEKANNPDTLAESGMMKTAQGMEVTPQEQAAMQVYQAKQRPTFDPITGQMMGAPDIIGNLRGQPRTQGINPNAQYEQPQGYGTGINPEGFDISQLMPQGMNPKEQQVYKEQVIREGFNKRKEMRDKTNPMKFNQDQNAAANFGNRMLKTSEIINNLPKNAEKAKTGPTGYFEQVISAIPLMGVPDKIGKGVMKLAATDDQQQYLNAAQNWIRANLRKESGAVIADQEMIDEYATYFPSAGDSQAVIDQKKELRAETEKGMIAQSAGAYDLNFGGNKSSKQQTPQYDKNQALQALKRRGIIK